MYRCEEHGHLTFTSRSQQLNEVPACAEKSNSTCLVCRALPQTYGGGYTQRHTQRHTKTRPCPCGRCDVVPCRTQLLFPRPPTYYWTWGRDPQDPQNITERTEGSGKPGGRRQLDRQSQNKFHLWEISRWPCERKRSRDCQKV